MVVSSRISEIEVGKKKAVLNHTALLNKHWVSVVVALYNARKGRKKRHHLLDELAGSAITNSSSQTLRADWLYASVALQNFPLSVLPLRHR